MGDWQDLINDNVIDVSLADMFKEEYPHLAWLVRRKPQGRYPSIRIKVARAISHQVDDKLVHATNVFIDYWSASLQKFTSVFSITDDEAAAVKTSDEMRSLVRVYMREAMDAMDKELLKHNEKPISKIDSAHG